MKPLRNGKTLAQTLLVSALIAIGGAGCLAPLEEDERVSDRPWSQTAPWENGLPGGLMQGR